MKGAAWVLLAIPAAGLHAAAQQPAPAPTTTAKPAAPAQSPPVAGVVAKSPAVIAAEYKAKLAENAAKLVELMGTRQAIEGGLDQMAHTAQNALQRENPSWNPQFTQEWGKQFRASMKPGEYVAAVMNVYEKHYTSWELADLILFQTQTNSGQPATVPPDLQAKLKITAPVVQSEIAAAFADIGERLGAQAGQQVANDHPDWLVGMKPTSTSAAR